MMRFCEDVHPYLCQSSEYLASTGSFVTHLDFWHEGRFKQYRGLLKGRYPYPDHPPEFFGIPTSSIICSNSNITRVNGWCAENILLEERIIPTSGSLWRA